MRLKKICSILKLVFCTIILGTFSAEAIETNSAPAIASTNRVAKKVFAPLPSAYEVGFSQWQGTTNRIGQIKAEIKRINPAYQENRKMADAARSARQFADAERYSEQVRKLGEYSKILNQQIPPLEYQEMKLRAQFGIPDPKATRPTKPKR